MQLRRRGWPAEKLHVVIEVLAIDAFRFTARQRDVGVRRCVPCSRRYRNLILARVILTVETLQYRPRGAVIDQHERDHRCEKNFCLPAIHTWLDYQHKLCHKFTHSFDE